VGDGGAGERRGGRAAGRGHWGGGWGRAGCCAGRAGGAAHRGNVAGGSTHWRLLHWGVRHKRNLAVGALGRRAGAKERLRGGARGVPAILYSGRGFEPPPAPARRRPVSYNAASSVPQPPACLLVASQPVPQLPSHAPHGAAAPPGSGSSATQGAAVAVGGGQRNVVPLWQEGNGEGGSYTKISEKNPSRDGISHRVLTWWVKERCACRRGRLVREQKKAKHYSTPASRVIPQPSTGGAQSSLTSEIKRDPVCSG